VIDGVIVADLLAEPVLDGVADGVAEAVKARSAVQTSPAPDVPPLRNPGVHAQLLAARSHALPGAAHTQPLPAAFGALPAAHAAHGSTSPPPAGGAANIPGAHAAQTVFAVVEQAVCTAMPSPQCAQALQAVSLAAEQGADTKKPAAQDAAQDEVGWHTRPAPDVRPSDEKPGAHVHALATESQTELAAAHVHVSEPLTGFAAPGGHGLHPGAACGEPTKP
jgi:hypothetical protein